MKMEITCHLTTEQVKDALREYISNISGIISTTAIVADVEFDGRSITHDIEDCAVTIKQL